jgi:2-oxo-4-hydroxy-4-carboxy-5-ureidoimidazoline decarboxylase
MSAESPCMSVVRLPLAALNKMDQSSFVSHVGWVYENSPWVAESAWRHRPFVTVENLHAMMDRVVRSATAEKQLALIQAHPDLAVRFGQLGQLTDASRREQADAGLNQLTPAQAAEMALNNALYRDKFGFPFIICARLNDFEMIREAFSNRLDNHREKEIAIALEEISKIGRLRLADAIL